MFKHDTEFQAYLDRIKAHMPEAPAMWECIVHANPNSRHDEPTYCRGWFKAVSDAPLFEKHFGCDNALSRGIMATYQERFEKRQVRVQFCTREEATHIELNGGGIVPLTRITRSNKLADIDPQRVQHDEALALSFVEDAHLDRCLASAS